MVCSHCARISISFVFYCNIWCSPDVVKLWGMGTLNGGIKGGRRWKGQVHASVLKKKGRECCSSGWDPLLEPVCPTLKISQWMHHFEPGYDGAAQSCSQFSLAAMSMWGGHIDMVHIFLMLSSNHSQTDIFPVNIQKNINNLKLHFKDSYCRLRLPLTVLN